MEQKRPIVVAGNGPSLARIDYRRLPKEFDTYRVNGFFNEEKYYLGKNVACYFNGSYFFDMFTPIYLSSVAHNAHSIYFIQNSYVFWPPFHELFHEYFTPPSLTEKHFVAEINAFIKQYRKYFHPDTPMMYPSTGMNALIKAVTHGYTEISVTGIEFSTPENWNYAFAPTIAVDQDENTVEFKKTIFVTKPEIFKEHQSDRFDKALVRFIASLPGIKLYAISEKSPLAEILPLAPIRNDDPYIPENKEVNPKIISEINTFVETETQKIAEALRSQQEAEALRSPKGCVQKIQEQFLARGMDAEWNALGENIYLRLLYQAVKPFWVFIKFILKGGRS